MRIDKYLYENSMAKSRTHAHSLIISGFVRCDGRIVMRPSFEVSGSEKIEISGDVCPYVSRGGLKLECALDEFGINPSGKTAVDIGASTGGFTDVLLRRGAKRVYALDSGHGQLHAKIASDPRVVSVEGFNARFLMSEKTPISQSATSRLFRRHIFIRERLTFFRTAGILSDL